MVCKWGNREYNAWCRDDDVVRCGRRIAMLGSDKQVFLLGLYTGFGVREYHGILLEVDDHVKWCRLLFKC